MEVKVGLTFQVKHTDMSKDLGYYNVEAILKQMKKTRPVKKYKDHKPLGAAAALSKALKNIKN